MLSSWAQKSGRIIQTPEIKGRQGWLASLVLTLYSHRHMAAHTGHRDIWQLTLALNMEARALWSHAVLTGIRTAITVWERPGLGAGLRHSLTLLSSHNDIHSPPPPTGTHREGWLIAGHTSTSMKDSGMLGANSNPSMAWTGAFLKKVSSGSDPE